MVIKKIIAYLFFVIIILNLITGCTLKRTQSLTGLYYQRINGKSHYIIDENNIPYILTNKTGADTIFDDLNNGDIIMIKFDKILESAPGRISILSLQLKQKGNEDDLQIDKIEEYLKSNY